MATGPESLRRLHVCLVTEGTYPHVVGGVSSWCDQLVRGLDDIDWSVLPITAGGWHRRSRFAIPPHVDVLEPLELWSRVRTPTRVLRRRLPGAVLDLPARLCRHLLWGGTDPDALLDTLVACRAAGTDAVRAFRTTEAWNRFVRTLGQLSAADGTDRYTDVVFSAAEAAQLWQTLSWVVRATSVDIPDCDVVLATAAGWPAVPAAVHRRLTGTPVVLAEHGVYVREAYLAASRGPASPGGQLIATGLAVSLARLAYAISDTIAPVTSAHRPWEERLGAEPARIAPIVNGIDSHEPHSPPGNGRTVVSVGRIDPLKDIVTMLRCARLTLDRAPDVQFLHYGPVPEHGEAYAALCARVHHHLGLGDRFRFMGQTADPHGAIREADVYLSTSISEGLPLSLLEAMTEGRPIVATAVGGCAEVVEGCGIVVNAGDPQALSHALTILLDDPVLTAQLGRRGHRRVRRRFALADQHHRYRSTLSRVADPNRVRPTVAETAVHRVPAEATR